ncbi:MAG: O-antigen ligase family protein [Candidatus Aminicenantes bacterium]|nr:O-antigen ligase family protein [Candidatus Aminicenantes bacterium]
MSKNAYLNLLKGFILLSPLPFGCVGKIFSPLFYMTLLVLSFAGLSVRDQLKTERGESVYFAFQNRIKLFTYIFFGFLLFQIIPLPIFILKLISPATVKSYFLISEQLPAFMTISKVPVETIMFGVRLLVIIIFLISFIKINIRIRELISIVNVLILSAVVQSLFGIIKYALQSDKFFLFFHQIDKPRKVEFLTGTLGNPNHFSFYLEMIIPLVLVLLLLKINLFESNNGFREKIISTFNQDKKFLFSFIFVVILSISIVLTGSRAGIMTLATTLILFGLLTFYLTRSRVFRKKIKIIFVTIAMVTLYVGIKNTSDKFMRTNFDNSGRFLRWPNSMKIFKDFPLFGTGFGTYKNSFLIYDTDIGGKWSTNAHNEYIETLTDGGLVGVLLSMTILGLLIYSILKMWKVRRHPRIRLFGIGILSSIYAALFHSFFDYSLRIPSNSFVFILLLGLGIKFVTYRREFSESGFPRKRENRIKTNRGSK